MSEEENTKESLPDSIETRVYEIGYLLIPHLPETELLGAVSSIKDSFQKEGASFISEGAPKMTKLAYPMRVSHDSKYQTYDSAYFGWLKHSISPENLSVVKEHLDADKNLIRFIVIKTVRENVFVPHEEIKVDKAIKGVVMSKEDEISESKEKKEKKNKEPVSEEEIDKTIDELVIE